MTNRPLLPTSSGSRQYFVDPLTIASYFDDVGTSKYQRVTGSFPIAEVL